MLSGSEGRSRGGEKRGEGDRAVGMYTYFSYRVETGTFNRGSPIWLRARAIDERSAAAAGIVPRSVPYPMIAPHCTYLFKNILPNCKEIAPNRTIRKTCRGSSGPSRRRVRRVGRRTGTVNDDAFTTTLVHCSSCTRQMGQPPHQQLRLHSRICVYRSAVRPSPNIAGPPGIYLPTFSAGIISTSSLFRTFFCCFVFLFKLLFFFLSIRDRERSSRTAQHHGEMGFVQRMCRKCIHWFRCFHFRNTINQHIN